MPTGSGKSSLYRFLYEVLNNVRKKLGGEETNPTWIVGDATFEKMGELMSSNSLGLFHELSSFLTQINIFKSRGLSDSHELAMFLQLYNGHSWTHTTVSGVANSAGYTMYHPGISSIMGQDRH